MTIQDISCVGKCSLTVALPIISAAGVEAGVLPTAVLSTHTMFSKYTFCDLTSEITPIADTFKELDIDFDAVYTGYLGSFEQLGLVEKFIDDFKKEGTTVLIDPVMADNGVLYKGFTEEFAARMRRQYGVSLVLAPSVDQLEHADALVLFSPRDDLSCENRVLCTLYPGGDVRGRVPVALGGAFAAAVAENCASDQLAAALYEMGIAPPERFLGEFTC